MSETQTTYHLYGFIDTDNLTPDFEIDDEDGRTIIEFGPVGLNNGDTATLRIDLNDVDDAIKALRAVARIARKAQTRREVRHEAGRELLGLIAVSDPANGPGLHAAAALLNAEYTA